MMAKKKKYESSNEPAYQLTKAVCFVRRANEKERITRNHTERAAYYSRMMNETSFRVESEKIIMRNVWKVES